MGTYRKEVKRDEVSIECNLCGKEFKNLISLSRHIKRSHPDVSTKDYYNLYLKTNKSEGFCQICTKPTKFLSLDRGYKETCCKTCTNIFKYGFSSPFCHQETHSKSRQTKLKRYGDAKYLNVEKQQETMTKKYGGTGLASPEIRKRIEETNLEKFGSKSPLGSKEIQEKVKQTNLDKYGVENVFSSEEIKEKIKETNLNNFGFENAMQSEEVKCKVRNILEQEYGGVGYASSTIREKAISTKNDKLKNFIDDSTLVLVSELDLKYPEISLQDCEFTKYQNSILVSKDDSVKALKKDSELKEAGYLSKNEAELHEWLKSIYTGEIQLNSKIPNTLLELDFYLPEKKLAIEFNGNYWHSTRFKDKNYHLKKTQLCQDLGINLIHIFEYEWLSSKEICKLIISLALESDIEHSNIQEFKIKKKGENII
jgi:csr/mutH/archaeal HJR family nuclease